MLLDENVDRRLKRYFGREVEVDTVTGHGWGGKKNGELLKLAAQEFDVLVTMDRAIEYQQNIRSLQLAIIIVIARSNRLLDIIGVVPEIMRLLQEIKPGEIRHVTT